jgi:hypothetical protein
MVLRSFICLKNRPKYRRNNGVAEVIDYTVIVNIRARCGVVSRKHDTVPRPASFLRQIVQYFITKQFHTDDLKAVNVLMWFLVVMQILLLQTVSIIHLT